MQLDKQLEYALTEVKHRLSGKRRALEASSKIYQRLTHFFAIAAAQEQGLKEEK